MAAPMEKCVELGFVEKCEDWQLASHFFPSKVGGKPSWLALKPLPTAEDLKCGRCGNPCVFLAQVYSPVNSKPSCFHRTVFVFVCKDPSCCKPNDSSNFVVLRCQLGRDNAFYSSEPPQVEAGPPTAAGPRAEDHGAMCALCGCAGPFSCAKCHSVNYCSKQHQAAHWKRGHKQTCAHTGSAATQASEPRFLFPEYEIVTEPDEQAEKPETQEKSESEKMKDYAEFMEGESSASLLTDQNVELKDLESMASGANVTDKQFEKFKKRTELEPEQVLRYERGAQPLWLSTEHLPSHRDIPPCSQCAAPRHFEFQVLPQLLSHLEVDSVKESLDWGTLAVYTCAESCDGGPAYHTEFLWKQDFSNTNI